MAHPRALLHCYTPAFANTRIAVAGLMNATFEVELEGVAAELDELHDELHRPPGVVPKWASSVVSRRPRGVVLKLCLRQDEDKNGNVSWIKVNR